MWNRNCVARELGLAGEFGGVAVADVLVDVGGEAVALLGEARHGGYVGRAGGVGVVEVAVRGTCWVGM